MTVSGGICRSTHGGGALVGRCAGCTQGAFPFVSKAGGWGSAGVCVKKTRLDAAEPAGAQGEAAGALAEPKETPEAKITVTRASLQRFHGGLPGEDVHHHQAVPRLPLAEVDKVGSFGPSAADLPRARPGRLHLPNVGLQRLEGHGLHHVEVAALQVGTASAGPAR